MHTTNLQVRTWALRAVAFTAVLALVAGGPVVEAHGGHASEGLRYVQVGPYAAYLHLQPYPAFVNTTGHFFLSIARNNTYEYPSGRLEVSGANGFQATLKVAKNASQYGHMPLTWGEKGNYSARLALQDGSQEVAQTVYYGVYPDLSFRITTDSSFPLASGRPAEIAVRVLHPTTGVPVDAFTDLRLQWGPVTGQAPAAAYEGESPMDRVGPGNWVGPVTFPGAATYELRFRSASGGFGFDDVPPLRVFADGPDPTPTVAESPSAAAWAVLASTGVAAIVLRYRLGRRG